MEECVEVVDNCFAYTDEEDNTYESVIENNEVRSISVNGETVDVLDFSTQDFSTSIDEYIALIADLDIEEYTDMDLSCRHTYMGDAYQLGNLTEPTVQQNCSVTFADLEGDQFLITTESFYLEGWGMVYTEAYSYINDVLFYIYTQDLLNIYYPPAFTDLNYTHGNFDAIMYLYEEEIIGGYPDGTFQADKTINRAELLKILVEGNGVTPDQSVYHNCFDDIKTDWYAKYVCYAHEQGWVDGYPDGMFRPADTVNKVEALKMLLNSQGIDAVDPTESPFEDVPSDQWFAKYVSTSMDMGILEEVGSLFLPDGDMARGGISENLYRLLTY